MLKRLAIVIALVLLTSCTSPTDTENYSSRVKDQVALSSPTYFRLVDGQLERRATSGEYFSKDSRSKQEFDPIRVKAYSNFRSYLDQTESDNINLAIILRPEFPSEIAKYSIAQVEAAMKFWSKELPDMAQVDVLLATEKDTEFMKQEGREYVTNLENFNRIAQIDKQYGDTWIMGEVRSSFSIKKFNSKLILATFSQATTERMQNGWIQVPAHETFHIVFDYYMNQKSARSHEEYINRAPQHFIEGAANYFSYSFAMENIGWYSDGLDVSLSLYWRGLGSWKSVKDEQDVVELLEATENSSPQQAFEASYAVGAIFAEWLVAEYGFKSLAKVLQNLALGVSFDENLRSAIGLGKDEAYREAAPYLLSIFKRLKLS